MAVCTKCRKQEALEGEKLCEACKEKALKKVEGLKKAGSVFGKIMGGIGKAMDSMNGF